MRFLSVIVGAAAAVAALGCETTGAVSAPPAAAEKPAPQPTGLGVGDVVEVRVFREEELDGKYRVSAHGEIDFPLIGKVHLAGREVEDIQREIKLRLADGYLKNPQVSVTLLEQNSRKVMVIGEVGRPGVLPYEDGMTVLQAITTAGGFGKLAAQNRVGVTRVEGESEQRYVVRVGDMATGSAPSFEVQPGDIIFVPESIF